MNTFVEKMKSKLESPNRVNQLKPKETLEKLGFTDGMTLCDIGAGTGLFSIQASNISKNNIYAIDISQDMVDYLNSKKNELSLESLIPIKIEGDRLPIESNTVDLALMITVLHEVNDMECTLKEVKRILKDSGKAYIVEFYKKETSFGPPVDIRIESEELINLSKKIGFDFVEEINISEGLYGILLKNQ